jgi:hypothetical protein
MELLSRKRNTILEKNKKIYDKKKDERWQGKQESVREIEGIQKMKKYRRKETLPPPTPRLRKDRSKNEDGLAEEIKK